MIAEREMGRIALVCSLILVLAFAVPACSKKQISPDEDEIEVVEEDIVIEEPAGKDFGIDEQGLAAVAARLKDAHFDFDRYNLSPEARLVLKDDYLVLKSLPNPRILVEGHCDDRGTVEYNLALGQKRADAARAYLISLGMPASSISTISYGKERPLNPANTEEAWAENRRAHINVLRK